MTKSSFCDLCKHNRNDLTCDAFPNEIPRSIYFDGEKHFESRGDDNGIVFEPKDDEKYLEAAISLGYVPNPELVEAGQLSEPERIQKTE